jgi:hypothetical protein
MSCLAALLALGLAPAAEEQFEKLVRPILANRCQQCHGEKSQRGGLRLDSRAAILKGGDSGPAAVPGKPEKSLLIQAVKHQGGLKMPKKDDDRLDPRSIAVLEGWVKDGLYWPEGHGQPKGPPSIDEARKQHWAFRPITRPVPPAVKGRADNPIDQLLLAKLEARGLSFAPPADRAALLRRLSLHLTGLPPTPEEREAWLADSSPTAFSRLVDRLLASPAYGERWGRHWLDVARYADTKGYVFLEERRYPYSYTYRDYVVAAFNDDLPYDTFLKHQVAADLMGLKERGPLAALGYLTLGRRFLNNQHDIIDDRIDVVTRGMMGLTVTCARCHDHKYDPVPTRDYYSLHGVFASSHEPGELPLLDEVKPPPERKKFEEELARRKRAVEQYLAEQRPVVLKRFRERAGDYMLESTLPGPTPQDLSEAMVQKWRAHLARAAREKDPFFEPWLMAKDRAAEAKRYNALFASGKHDDKGPFDLGPDLTPYLVRDQRDKLTGLRRKVDEWTATGPGAPPRAMVLADLPAPVTSRVLIRGSPGRPGAVAPRQFLEILAPGRKPFSKGSGRLELAEAIASKDNPLTARVMANRVWMHHFGRGLVATPGDFGTRGEPPTHPELLDWLAAELIDSGWSVKHLHRLILHSSAYRQSADSRPEGEKADPENRLLWRYHRRRLELEPLRDSILATAGLLDRRMGGPGVDITSASAHRRTVYAYIERQNLPGVFRAFDLASPDVSTAKRHETAVPQQALFLMNSQVLKQASAAFASRPDLAGLTTEARARRMYLLAFGRSPDRVELEAGLAFAESSGWEPYAQALLMSNEMAFTD